MKYRHLIFDFDGVLVESNAIRFEGFRLLFKGYPEDEVEQLVRYAQLNAGKSRYEKIRYFFEAVRNEPVSDDDVNALAKRYSELVKQKVIDAPAVKGSVEFLRRHHNAFNFAVISGSDQGELREVCRAHKIDNYFLEILGSPASKESNIRLLLAKRAWTNEECLFIGDSINDLDAAKACGIDFVAKNSGVVDWSSINNVVVVDDFAQLELFLKGELK